MSISKHYNAARRLAMSKLIAAARKILREHQNLAEFVCAMGTAEFTTRRAMHDGLPDTIDPNERSYMRPVARILDEWDEYLKLTGEGIRFAARGKIIRNW